MKRSFLWLAFACSLGCRSAPVAAVPVGETDGVSGLTEVVAEFDLPLE